MFSYQGVPVDCNSIVDWETFHDAFGAAFGFPAFYGRNMNAWIDCMTSLDEPGDGLTSVHAPTDGCVVLQLESVKSFSSRCPEQYSALIESTAFVNWRRIESGEPPILVLAFDA